MGDKNPNKPLKKKKVKASQTSITSSVTDSVGKSTKN